MSPPNRRLRRAVAAAWSRDAAVRTAVVFGGLVAFAVLQAIAFASAMSVDLTTVVAALYLLFPVGGLFLAESIRDVEEIYRPLVVGLTVLGIYAVTDLLGTFVAQPALFVLVFEDVALFAATGSFLVGLARWVDRRDDRERQLRKRERELQQQNDRLEQFASVVSHDLRNPLQVADGHLTLVRETGDLDRLDDVDRALGRMNDIIEDALSLARTDEDSVETTTVTLEAVATDAWETVETYDATLEVEDGVVTADPDLLQRVFENLFRNAVEHGGHEVTVGVGPIPQGFYVEDDGPGIPPEKRETVLEAGYTSEDDGTGFGLAIANRIAEVHGWDLVVTESQAVTDERAVAPGVDRIDTSDERFETAHSSGARFEFRGIEWE